MHTEMNYYHLIPYPRKLAEHGGFFCGKIGDATAVYGNEGHESVRFVLDADFTENEYRLEITERGIVITAGSETSKLYGATTLGQLVRQFGEKIPCLTIEDSPLASIRMVQICIGQVNVEFRRDWFVRFIRKMAELKITHIGIYFEWNFRFPSVPHLNNPHYPDRADMEYVQREASKYGIIIVPEFAFMGHSKDLLELEGYADIRECDKGASRETETHYDSLCLTHPKTRVLIERIINDICDIFTGDLVHIGGDEVGHIGECAMCKKRKEEVGTMGLYLDFIEFVAELLSKKGKKTCIWGDMLLMLSDGSPFWIGHDCELDFRADAIERLKALKDRIVIFDWWYSGVNKASIDFFRGLGLQVVACTASNGCDVSSVNLGQLQNARLLCEYALQNDCAGIMMCDWINYLGNHAEQQYVFYAAAACFGWSGVDASYTPDSDDFYVALGENLYDMDGRKLKDFWQYAGCYDSELLSFYPEKERGLALRKYVFQTDNPLIFYLNMKNRFAGETLRKYGFAVKKLGTYASALSKKHEQNDYIDFVLLSVLLHETLLETFITVEAAEKEYRLAAEKQYCDTDKKVFYESLYACAEKLKDLKSIYANISRYIEKEYELLGNDGAARVRIVALLGNIDKLVAFITDLQDGHRPLPSFKNISENLFAAQRCSEWNGRETDWANENARYVSYCVDDGKSWFCRPFACTENH